ncbi:hypothetical protein BU24DRAFT_19415 [Aaosphaeria arxii CBS 175.79]|uniref:Uncharacterized protein n=1 Tax=Aaosphaeria arxii CBS 175.79 TaxID=1450172 RepID=A0A6A5Y6Z5_9PLEO|nr:uncharacterized protein BU24DRAFT_19415 [Aaosphaeria arxii CBS 175.79]KAF2021332.1 hypothetical protein BU24DRAFT_19415 [Aaosphaeria arxii CBS 175.79]
MVPLQFAAEYPRFLTHEPVQICPGFTAFDWERRDTDVMKRDRFYYLDCVREIACLEGGIARDYYELLARPDECRRYWWFRAVCQADIHRAMCACDWNPVEEDIS